MVVETDLPFQITFLAQSETQLHKVLFIYLIIILHNVNAFEYCKVLFFFVFFYQVGNGTLSMEFKGELNDRMKGFYRSKYANPKKEVTHLAVTQFEVFIIYCFKDLPTRVIQQVVSLKFVTRLCMGLPCTEIKTLI